MTSGASWRVTMARNKPSQRPAQTPTPRPAAQSPEVVRRTVQTQFHQGPLPPPELLRQYDAVSAGAADRIIAMAEGEAAHRRDAEQKQLDADIALRNAMAETERRRIDGVFQSDKIGQILGAVVSATAILTAGGTTVVGLVYGIDSQWYWAIPVALVSLPVLGMVKAIRSRPAPTRGEIQASNDD